MKSFILKEFPTDSVGLEIGVWAGDFSLDLINHLNPAKLYLCDPWEYMPQFPDRWYGGRFAKSQADMDLMYRNVCNKFEIFNNVEIIRDYSKNLLSYIDESSLDWVYIDGDHSYESVLLDLELSYKLIKNTGIISGDDYDLNEPNDIVSAVTEFELRYANKIKKRFIEKRQFILNIEK